MQALLEELARIEKATRGKKTEKQVEEMLTAFQRDPLFDYQRLPDARSCMGRIPKQIGDFLWFYGNSHGVLEVKELKHDYRLPHDNVSQLPKLRRREMAGGKSFVIVKHTAANVWRIVSFAFLWDGKNSPSWDLREIPTYPAAPITLLSWYESTKRTASWIFEPAAALKEGRTEC